MEHKQKVPNGEGRLVWHHRKSTGVEESGPGLNPGSLPAL